MPTFYTDGSCDNRHPDRPGGTGYVRVLRKGQHILKVHSRPYAHTTNNRMELLAIIHALESLTKPSKVRIVSDSMVCIKVARKLASSQVYNGLANKDLWFRYKQVACLHRVEFIHVRGHRGDHFNEIADKLAGRAYQLAKKMNPADIADNKMGDPGLGGRPSGSLF